MRVAILEDEPLAEARLRDLLEAYPGGSIEVTGATDSVAEAIEQIDTWQADLLLCDIRLADGLSFNLWAQREVKTPTIFTTAYEEYALRAFKVNSVDYLLKPINAPELYAALDRYVGSQMSSSTPVSADLVAKVAAMLQQPQYAERLLSRVGDKLTPLPVAQIAYVLSIDRISWAYTSAAHRYPLNETLDELEALLPPRQFKRLNRSCIANATGVKQLTAYSNSRFRAHLTGHTGEPIVVARDRVQGIKDWLGG